MAGGRTSVMCARGADSARLPSRLTIPASARSTETTTSPKAAARYAPHGAAVKIKLSTRGTALASGRGRCLARRPPASANVVCRRCTERREPCIDLVAEGDVSVRSCEGERVLRHRDGLRRLVTASVRDRAIEPDPGVARVEPERLLEMLPGLPRAAHVHQDARQAAVGIGVVRLQSQRPLQVLEGVLWATELEKHGAKIVVGIRVVRLQLESALVVFGRLLSIILSVGLAHGRVVRLVYLLIVRS